MRRKQEILSKTTLAKIEKFKTTYPDLEDSFIKKFVNQITNDVKYIKDCAEVSIVDFYLETFDELINDNDYLSDEFFEKLKNNTRHKLVVKYVPNKTFDNNIDIYFNEVKREYILHPMNESESMVFLPENKDVFIKNNLKLVINCAKRYQNLGLPLEDLIQTGNLGLMIAFEKFDTNRANLRVNILKSINDYPSDIFSYNEAIDIIKTNFKYSKLLESTINKIPEGGFDSKESFIEWTNKNIKTASFSSIGFSWIRATIVTALNSLVNTVHVPKSAKDKGFKPANMIRLDSINPHTNDNYTDNIISEYYANDEIIAEDSSIEKIENDNLYKELVEKLLLKLSPLERRVIKKRFAIGYPFEMSIQEIAENEGISTSTVKTTINNATKILYNNINAEDKKTLMEILQ